VVLRCVVANVWKMNDSGSRKGLCRSMKGYPEIMANLRAANSRLDYLATRLESNLSK
jgi:hypothetical protein